MSRRQLRVVLFAGMGALVLAGCDGSSGGGGNGAGARVEDNFGNGFAAAFRADENAAPKDPARNDLIAVDVTADPVPIP